MATKTVLKSGNIRVQFRGKGQNFPSKTFPNKKEADAYITRIEEQIQSVDEIDSSSVPVDMKEFFSSLLPEVQDNVALKPVFVKSIGISKGNNLTMSQLCDKFFEQYTKKDENIYSRLGWWMLQIGHLKVHEVTDEHVLHYIDVLKEKGSTGKKGVAPKTTNRFKANLSSLFQWGKTSSYRTKNNPCTGIPSASEGEGRQRYLSEDEQVRFLKAAKLSSWDRFYALILLTLTCGARRGELAKLRWSDIDFSTQQAMCRNTKNGSDKVLQLTDNVVAELRKFRKIGDGLVFASPFKPSSAYSFKREWCTAMEQAEIPELDANGERLVFHSLRHTLCSTLANRGVDLHDIASIAGHKSIHTTMKYTHKSERRKREVTQQHFANLG